MKNSNHDTYVTKRSRGKYSEEEEEHSSYNIRFYKIFILLFFKVLV